MPKIMSPARDHAGWTDRGYLPHYDSPGLVQAVTFRLADSMPSSKRAEWQHLLLLTDDAERILQLERYLDQGAGSCLLRQTECAAIVQNALRHFHKQRHRLVRHAQSRARAV